MGTAAPHATVMRRTPLGVPPRPASLIEAARAHERSGCVTEAAERYLAAAAEAARTGELAQEAEAYRRLSVLHHHRGETTEARQCCERSYGIAVRAANMVLAAEALNVKALFALETGDLELARGTFARALAMGGRDPALVARVEQNLGVLANVQGRYDDALEHYHRSLDGHQRAGDEYGSALAWHNLGMICSDRAMWAEAHEHFERSRAIAESLGDLHLTGLCLLNHSEVHVALGRYDQAKRNAEEALAIFDQLGSLLDKTDAYRVIGVVYRETGRATLAESRFRSAIELSITTGSVLSQAESSRELALLYQSMGRNQDALSLLNTAHGLFGQLEATRDVRDVSRKVQQLESTFLKVVRDWGQSIESSDSYTFGHCQRVASYAEQVARALGLGEQELTAVRLGAYLHDVGKIRVPHEILNKPGRLSEPEFDIIKRHPEWGVELLETVEFPWDIKPIIRWHHEKYDGTGYPDQLKGDAIPVAAMIIGIVDVFDALTTTRSYRPAMTIEQALATMETMSHHWRADVYWAFTETVARAARASGLDESAGQREAA